MSASGLTCWRLASPLSSVIMACPQRIAAAQTASEYSLGTLRQLLVRQPRRTIC
jgi:hypothetical protein